MTAKARAFASAASLPDPADDWSGDEPAVARAARRKEFWPQLFATLERSLFIVWGVVLASLLLLEIWVGWSAVFSTYRGMEGEWGVAVVLTVVGAWLAFYTAGEMDVELEENPGPALG
jgi:hypothetical protein